MLCFSTVSLFAIERVRVMRFPDFCRRPFVQFAAVGLAAAAVGVSVQTWATTPTQSVAQAIKARLPKTQITSVNCEGFGGLCEVVAGSSLFYTDREARFLIVGRLYNMETRQDVTATRLLSLNPDLLIGGAARAARQKESEDGETQPAQLGRAQAALPKEGAIVWGAASGQTVTVFSDFRCGYCRQLSSVLAELGVRVIERPISVLGTRLLSEQVYCAKNQQRALKAAYDGEALQSAKCDVLGLDANERFARANGFSGTPVIVRSDGAVIEGYRLKEVLAKWLAGGKS
jgi:thiol:disulfide interchange protein DsbC